MNKTKKKVLLIGGSGFIGFNLCKYLVKNRNYSITIADNQFRGKRDEDLDSLIKSNNIKFVDADFTDKKS